MKEIYRDVILSVSMDRNFFLQGLSSKTYADEVKWVLQTPDIKRVIISVAFLNEEGVSLLESELKKLVKETVFYCGIRNEITSYQGLLRLLINGHRIFTVDTGSRGRIFHPKIYYARGAHKARLSVGSGNLTLGGLNNNIEAGLGLEIDVNIPNDNKFILNFESQFDELSKQYPENIILITDKDKLETIRNSGTLLDEDEVSPPRPAASTTKDKINDTVPRIKLPITVLYPTIKKIRRQKTTTTKKQAESIINSPVSTSLMRVWQSKPLTERDLNIPSADNTHSTGSINLDKGLLEEHVDHRHYFREEVFAALEWSERDGSEVEEASAIFQLIIKAHYLGEHELQIRHTTSTTSTSYHQHNAMTRLSWGTMRDLITKPDYIGRSLTLYSDETNTSKFVLEID